MTDVRRVERRDWDGIWPLVQAMGTDESESVAGSRFERLVTDPLWAIFVADDDSQIVGYAAAQDLGTHFRYGDAHRMARFHDLWVTEATRGRGVGRALVAAMIDWASSRVRYLEWQAHESRSAPFYEHLGYHGDPCPQPDYPSFVIDFRG